MTLQDYLTDLYQVTETEEEGRIRFNVKRGEFSFQSRITYNSEKTQDPNFIKLIGNAVETKYNTWKFLQDFTRDPDYNKEFPGLDQLIRTGYQDADNKP